MGRQTKLVLDFVDFVFQVAGCFVRSLGSVQLLLRRRESLLEMGYFRIGLDDALFRFRRFWRWFCGCLLRPRFGRSSVPERRYGRGGLQRQTKVGTVFLGD